MSIVDVNRVTHLYGDRITFQNVSLRLLKGEHIGLVGANGAGKSTFLKLLTGTLLPDHGNISWLPDVRVGYLEQHVELPLQTTLKEYLQTAFRSLYAKEEEMQQLAVQMAHEQGELERLLHQYGKLQTELENNRFYELDAKIEEVASGLGFDSLRLDYKIKRLSGGQQTKLLLAKLLLEQPDVLLMDEPTNYLDEPHIAWLTDYLVNYEQAFVVVPHDELFLNKIANVIFHAAHQTITRYAGNYEQFLKSDKQKRIQLKAKYEKQTREIEKLKTFIDKNRNRKARQAKSREKALSKISRSEPLLDAPEPRFVFQAERKAPAIAIEAKEAGIGYSGLLFPPVTLTVKRNDKIAIVGENGMGKSTLVKTLLGKLPPLEGTIAIGDDVKVAYFQQEDLATRQTALEAVSASYPNLTQAELRRTLAMTGLTAEHIEKPISTLSGGEQAKVRLSILMLTTNNMLVLDEPTNHLDLKAKKALKRALTTYEGTVLLVSHEQDFYQDWVTDIWSIHQWRE